ncbi:hypothetical protein MC7420_8204 [Coleofasciculus chthonoplastes PCC 7420]|uniref:Uncharacterized protein n=1 Tax=Coleofasciculus chthonoplastes PCC 7420 TaxID=118168 RepID=B4W4C6_9CYAN|nr:hypothetical protein MC7420_8204 [Coleofasciculus chthonoplastes PCC 7420]
MELSLGGRESHLGEVRNDSSKTRPYTIKTSSPPSPTEMADYQGEP